MTAQDTTTKYAGYARSEVLVTPQWLEEHLLDPALRVVEVDVSPADYDAGHIDGAVLWNVYSDLKDSSYRLAGKAGGRKPPRPLRDQPGLDGSAVRLRTRHGPMADEAIWPRRRPRARLRAGNLAGRRPAVDQRRSQPGHRPISPPRPGQPDPRRPSQGGRCDRRPACTIVDVRTEAEYRGERFWPSGGSEPGGRAGHIPSAVNLLDRRSPR